MASNASLTRRNWVLWDQVKEGLQKFWKFPQTHSRRVPKGI